MGDDNTGGHNSNNGAPESAQLDESPAPEQAEQIENFLRKGSTYRAGTSEFILQTVFKNIDKPR